MKRFSNPRKEGTPCDGDGKRWQYIYIHDTIYDTQMCFAPEVGKTHWAQAVYIYMAKTFSNPRIGSTPSDGNGKRK